MSRISPRPQHVVRAKTYGATIYLREGLRAPSTGKCRMFLNFCSRVRADRVIE